MTKYIVKSGDTLYSIATRILGNPALVGEIKKNNNLNSDNLKLGMELLLPVKTKPKSVTTNVPISVEQKTKSVPNNIESEPVPFLIGDKFYYKNENGTQIEIGSKRPKGIMRVGQLNPEKFAIENSALLNSLKLTSSEIKVLSGVSKNEGNLDAINSWDNAFFSWGMFQWTIGTLSAQGELPALLKLIQSQKPALFQTYFDKFGISISSVTSDITGFLILDKQEVNNPTIKERFRDPIWAMRFIQAGLNPEIASIQILFAVNRLNRFYFKNETALGGVSLSKLLNSEYAVGLLLDNHVNRPAWVVPCVVKAIGELGLSFNDLSNADDATEGLVIERYLQIRETYQAPKSSTKPMTHAKQRGEKIANSGLSKQRNSFLSGSKNRSV